MDYLTHLFARMNDNELWGLIYEACYDVYGYERLLRADPPIPPSNVITLFDVVTTLEGILNDGLSRFFTDSNNQQRIIQSFRGIGDQLTARLLKGAMERVAERRREGCENPEMFKDDERLAKLDSELIRRHKNVQDALAKFVRTNFADPDFFGEEFREILRLRDDSGWM